MPPIAGHSDLVALREIADDLDHAGWGRLDAGAPAFGGEPGQEGEHLGVIDRVDGAVPELEEEVVAQDRVVALTRHLLEVGVASFHFSAHSAKGPIRITRSPVDGRGS